MALVFILASAPSALGCTASSTIGSTSPRATHTLQQHTHFVPPVLRVLALWLAIVRYDPGLDTSLPVPNALEVEGHVLSFSVVVRCGRTILANRRAAYGGTVGRGGSPTGLRMRPWNEKFFTL